MDGRVRPEGRMPGWDKPVCPEFAESELDCPDSFVRGRVAARWVNSTMAQINNVATVAIGRQDLKRCVSPLRSNQGPTGTAERHGVCRRSREACFSPWVKALRPPPIRPQGGKRPHPGRSGNQAKLHGFRLRDGFSSRRLLTFCSGFFGAGLDDMPDGSLRPELLVHVRDGHVRDGRYVP